MPDPLLSSYEFSFLAPTPTCLDADLLLSTISESINEGCQEVVIILSTVRLPCRTDIRLGEIGLRKDRYALETPISLAGSR